eukprot:TRINITY_DN1079_c0_g1_i1.p1 TRINITY_DN1079_c0_g1~~TRINITY_DN1079_c0_g1_i1.p1  ORF type:complete len:558 (-),score=221.67 TRINITY_DN1079_c0_g1_i1:138-1811(-)
MSHMLQPSIILLKEGTDTSQGKAQIISNINACAAVVDTIRTTLGPRGLDKLIYEDRGKTIISNDGATILKQLDIVHPAAQTLVDIAKSQDQEVGDGTTSVVVLAGELLKESKSFIEDGVHPQIIIRGLRKSMLLAIKVIKDLSVSLVGKDPSETRIMLERCAQTALSSKLVASHKEFFGKMIVDAVMLLDSDLELQMIGIKKETGGSLGDSIFVEGVAFKKCFSYAGFEQQPKNFENPKILLLNLELELKAEKDNAEVRIQNIDEYQKIVDAEWKIIYTKLEKIVESGAQIILSRLAIGDLATQYFADRNIFCAGRVPEEDLKRVAKATGGQIQTTVSNVVPSVLGTCGKFEERQVGNQRYNFLTQCKETKSATIILRGGGEQFNDEAERSIHDAIMVVRRARKHGTIVPGGGAVEMEISKELRAQSRNIQGKQQHVMNAFAKALEVIPRQIADNAGCDATDILNKLRHKHHQGGKYFGVDIINDGICDTYERFVWEPQLVKLNSITAATEAACLVLSIDETVRNPKANDENASAAQAAPVPRGGAGRGRGGFRGRR